VDKESLPKRNQLNLNNIPYYDLGLDLDLPTLKKETKTILDKFGTEDYDSQFFLARRKYRKAWSGVSLWGSNGELYSDFREGDYVGENKPTMLERYAPYMFSVIEEIYGKSPKSRVRLMRIRPGKSLLWHSHVQEHGQDENELTIQIPINLPSGFKYCVVDKDEFRWYKRLYPPSWFKSAQCFELEEGRAYYFNSYHYHNVYNNSKEWRDTLMFYVDINHKDIQRHFRYMK
tara:strand:+ start:6065 stop:6757 length:693 start_codon:yes stop_codon:yes gene_type:complete